MMKQILGVAMAGLVSFAGVMGCATESGDDLASEFNTAELRGGNGKGKASCRCKPEKADKAGNTERVKTGADDDQDVAADEDQDVAADEDQDAVDDETATTQADGGVGRGFGKGKGQIKNKGGKNAGDGGICECDDVATDGGVTRGQGNAGSKGQSGAQGKTDAGTTSGNGRGKSGEHAQKP